MNTPESPAELLAMQGALSDNARKVLDLCAESHLDITDVLAVLIELTQDLLREHADVLSFMIDEPEADRRQLSLWATDTERLAQALELLRSVDPGAPEEGGA